MILIHSNNLTFNDFSGISDYRHDCNLIYVRYYLKVFFSFNSICVLGQRYGAISKQRLDRAILTFFQHFRKSYVGDQAMHSSKV